MKINWGNRWRTFPGIGERRLSVWHRIPGGTTGFRCRCLSVWFWKESFQALIWEPQFSLWKVNQVICSEKGNSNEEGGLTRVRCGMFALAIRPNELGDHKFGVAAIHPLVSFLPTVLSNQGRRRGERRCLQRYEAEDLSPVWWKKETLRAWRHWLQKDYSDGPCSYRD